MEGRLEHSREIVGIFDDAFAKKDWAEWMPILEANGIGYTAIACGWFRVDIQPRSDVAVKVTSNSITEE